MSLWNPYTFGPTGERTSVSAPPVLRVQGGQMTAAQLSMAQATFVKFCGRSRVSFWQNPNEFGLLPDGSQYRIMTIGAQQFMDVWPAQDQEDGVRFLYRPEERTRGRCSVGSCYNPQRGQANFSNGGPTKRNELGLLEPDN